MSEQETVELIYSIYDRHWVISQWWFGTSFLLLAVCHLGKEHLNWLTTTLMIFLYIAFSVWLQEQSVNNAYPIAGYLNHLKFLSNSAELSEGTRMLIERQELFDPIFQQIAKAGAFIVAIVYPIYITFTKRRDT